MAAASRHRSRAGQHLGLDEGDEPVVVDAAVRSRLGLVAGHDFVEGVEDRPGIDLEGVGRDVTIEFERRRVGERHQTVPPVLQGAGDLGEAGQEQVERGADLQHLE